MKPVKILYVIGSLGIGGAEGHLVQVIRNLDRQRFAPQVLCLTEGGPLEAPLRDMGVPVTICGLARLRGRSPLTVLGALWRMGKTMRAARPDIVHAYLYWANVIGGTLGRMVGTPVVITSRRSLGLFKDGKPYYQWLENLVNVWTDAVTVNSASVLDDVLSRERIGRGKLQLIYNGVEWERYASAPAATVLAQLRAELGLPGGAPVVGCVANLIHYKGHADLLAAAARVLATVPDAHFVLVGRDGGMRSALEAQAELLGIRDRVIFTGAREDVPALMHLFDVQVLASHEEGFSNVVLEAMAAGRPLVVTRVGGNAEAVLDGVTGRVVPPRAPDELAAAILQYLQDREAALAAGRKARERVVAEFSVPQMMTGLVGLYQDLLAARGRSAPRDLAAVALLPPKILEVCAVDFSAYYSFRGVLEAAVADEYDVTLACTAGPYVPRLQAMGVRHIPVRVPRRLRPLAHVRAVWELYRLMRRERYDLVHTHTPLASILARIAAWLAGVPVVLYTAHGFYFHERMPGWLYRTHVALERMLGGITHHLVTVSREDYDTAVREGIMAPERVTFVANGVDLDRFNPGEPGLGAKLAALRAELQLPADAPVVGIVGRVGREKGHFEFVRAVRLVLDRVPDAHFLVVGDPLSSDRDRPLEALQGLVAELGIADHVHFLGLREDVPQLLALMNVFTLPSYREGMPLVVLEAMAMAVPVVATRIRGSRELVAEGESGYLVDVGDHVALADRIGDLLANPALARRMGATARRRVEQRHSLTGSAGQMMAVIARLITNREGARL